MNVPRPAGPGGGGNIKDAFQFRIIKERDHRCRHDGHRNTGGA